MPVLLLFSTVVVHQTTTKGTMPTDKSDKAVSSCRTARDTASASASRSEVRGRACHDSKAVRAKLSRA